jgi:membrane fusion protein (multidrug efflux system)
LGIDFESIPKETTMTESDPKVTPAQGTIDRGTRSSRRKVAIFLGVALSCIIGGIVVLAFLPPRSEKVVEAAPRALAVAVHEAVVTNLSEVVIMPGRVEAEKEARLAVETGGRVLWLGVEKGDRVEAGQVLLRLDSRSQTAAVSRAEVNLRQAEDDLKRWQVLKETGSVSALEFEGVLNRRDLARIALDEARTDYERCSVRSPIDGLIEERPVEIGETVMPGVPVLRVVQMDRVKVMVDVPERDVMALPPGAEVCLEADAAPGMTFTGKVAFAAAVADPRSNTFRNEILVENRAGFLKPGMIARVAVVRGVIRNTVVVPLSALIPVKGQYVVYLVEDNRAVRRVVKLRAVIDTLAAVQEGLAPGDRVVVEGQRLVTDGTVVTVAP